MLSRRQSSLLKKWLKALQIQLAIKSLLSNDEEVDHLPKEDNKVEVVEANECEPDTGEASVLEKFCKFVRSNSNQPII